MKKAYFVDLDNTIYFTKPHLEILLGPVYRLLENENLGISDTEFHKAKEEMLHTPFQKVAQKYHFRQEAITKTMDYLTQKELTDPMHVHDEYHFIKTLEGLKIIVTAGFEKPQKSKIKMLGIAGDFDDVFVVDVDRQNKKDVFMEVMEKYGLLPADILVIGDDAESEIKFGLELGMETFLFDPEHRFPNAVSTYVSTSLKDLTKI